jgi:hypothetical protein
VVLCSEDHGVSYQKSKARDLGLKSELIGYHHVIMAELHPASLKVLTLLPPTDQAPVTCSTPQFLLHTDTANRDFLKTNTGTASSSIPDQQPKNYKSM